MGDGYNNVMAGKRLREESLDTLRGSDVYGDPDVLISYEQFAAARFCLCISQELNATTKTETADPIYDVKSASDWNSCQCDISLIEPDSDSDSAEDVETDNFLTALMQSQNFPSSVQKAETSFFCGLDSLLSSACRDINTCCTETFMGGDHMSIYEPVRLLRRSCTPPKIFRKS
jgi:hypothetical protein